MNPTSPLMILLMALAGGCAQTHHASSPPSPINHVVLIKLDDPTKSRALRADCDTLLPGISYVDSYWSGQHLDVGRAGIDGDYDVALCVGFTDQAAYEGYIVDPAHVDLVTRWKPEFEWIRIHDVVDHSLLTSP